MRRSSERVREGGRVVRKALVLAYGVHESGYREVIALDVGEAETEAFWRSFLRDLVKRGLTGVQLVISDAQAGLKKAIGQVLGCPWQRCSVHFLREALGHARREQQPMLAALLRPIFSAESGEQARELLGVALDRLRTPLPKIADLLGGGGGGPARLLPAPGRALAEAALDQPARARQPRDRTAHRRRRHLPQRPLAPPARCEHRHRTKRRMTRRPPLPLTRLARVAAHAATRQQQQRTGGARAHRGLSRQPCRRVTPPPGT
jgi:Transposase, Mutator family